MRGEFSRSFLPWHRLNLGFNSRGFIIANVRRRSATRTYQATPYPAATLVEMESDWSQLKTLEVDVTLDASYPDADVQLMIKVIDRLHQTDHTDTYRGQWTITRGQTQHIRISREEILQGPDDRQLDLTKIKYLDLMLLDPVAETKVRFDNLRLTLQALE
jgi:hypothetical protein